jgi:hypothetical protein
LVRFCAGNQSILGKQKILRIIRRASGWFAQVVVDDGVIAPPKVKIETAVGIDVGLTSFAMLDTGEPIDKPRFFRVSERKLKRAQQRLCRRHKGSRNRRKAVRHVARVHERIAAQRKDFAHQESQKLVNRFDLIGFEALNFKGLAAGMLAKSVHDAAWGMFLFFVTYKAALDTNDTALYNTSIIPIEEICWAAGFFDGEGSILIVCGIRGKRRLATDQQFWLEVTVANCVLAPLEYLAETFGGKVVSVTRKTENYRQGYRWRCYSQQAVAFLRAVMPYLKVKQEEAAVGIAFQDRVLW